MTPAIESPVVSDSANVGGGDVALLGDVVDEKDDSEPSFGFEVSSARADVVSSSSSEESVGGVSPLRSDPAAEALLAKELGFCGR